MKKEKNYGKAGNGFNLLLSVMTLLLLGLMFIMVPLGYNKELADPIIVSKTFYFLFFLVGVFFLFSFYSFSRIRAIKLEVSKIDIFLCLLVVYIIANRYIIQLNYGFSIRFIELLGLVFFYIILRFIPTKQYLWLLLFVLMSGITQAIFGVLQTFGLFPSLNPNFGLTGSFFNPGPYGGFLVICGVLAMGMLVFEDKIVKGIKLGKGCKHLNILDRCAQKIFHFIPLLGLITILIVLPATRSRAAWLAMVTGFTFIFIYRYQPLFFSWIKQYKDLGFYKKKLLLIAVFGIILSGLFGIYKFKEDSAKGRLLTWKVSADIVKEHPIVGVGYDQFTAHFMEAQANFFSENSHLAEAMLADNTYYAFNFPLQFTVENGLIGLFLLCTIGFFCIKVKPIIQDNYIKQLILVTLVAFVILGLFSYPDHILPIKMIIVLMVALLSIVDSKKIIIQFPVIPSSKPKIYIVKISMIFICLMVIGSAVQRTTILKKGYEGWHKALIAYDKEHYKSSVDKFKKIYPVFYRNGDFLMQYGRALEMAEQYVQAIKVLEQSKSYLNVPIIEISLGNSYKNLHKIQEAEEAYQKASNMVPNRFYPEYMLAKLFDETGQREKAFSKALAVLEKEVKIPSEAIEEIRAEMKKITKKNEVVGK